MKMTFKKVCKITQKFILFSILLVLSFKGLGQYRPVEEKYRGTRSSVLHRPVGVQMGFKFSPFISTNAVESSGEYRSFDSNGAAIRLSLGPIADLFFSDKYAFSTGLWYTVKSVRVSNAASFLSGLTPPGTATSSQFNLQYLQIPISFKLLTNEVEDRLKIYLQFGAVADVKLAEKPINKPLNALFLYNEAQGRKRSFGVGDFNLLLAAGGEYALQGTDALFFGLSYHRGLANIYRDRDLLIKNNCFFLDLGYKF